MKWITDWDIITIYATSPSDAKVLMDLVHRTPEVAESIYERGEYTIEYNPDIIDRDEIKSITFAR